MPKTKPKILIVEDDISILDPEYIDDMPVDGIIVWDDKDNEC